MRAVPRVSSDMTPARPTDFRMYIARCAHPDFEGRMSCYSAQVKCVIGHSGQHLVRAVLRRAANVCDLR